MHVMWNKWTLSEERGLLADINSCSIVGTDCIGAHESTEFGIHVPSVIVADRLVQTKSAVGHRGFLMRFGTAISC